MIDEVEIETVLETEIVTETETLVNIIDVVETEIVPEVETVFNVE